MWQDLRQALRTLGHHPGFVALAAFVLALGVGLNTAIFSIVYAMLFRPLPVTNPSDLASIYGVRADVTSTSVTPARRLRSLSSVRRWRGSSGRTATRWNNLSRSSARGKRATRTFRGSGLSGWRAT